MKLKIDSDGKVTGWALSGDIEGGIDYSGIAPDDFYNNYEFYQFKNGQVVFDATLQTQSENSRQNEEKITELTSWFDDYYDKQVAQYARTQRLGIAFDGDIVALDAEAADKQMQIRNIRKGSLL